MKSVCITGANSGLGKALSEAFHSKGYFIHLVGRNKQALEEVKQQLPNSDSILCDLSLQENVESLFTHLSLEHPVEIFINNAGIGCFGPLKEVTREALERTFQVNTLAPILLAKHYLDYCVGKSFTPQIINIISTAGLRGKVNESVYAASKFALRGFGESLQKEYEGSARVVNAYMGGMNTPFWENSSHVADPSRFRTPKEVANWIAAHHETEDTIILESKK
ncbi:hypothetical protein Q75_02455 [Bacillus coahuilensis p1.1.43]|uniref:Short-chain dehydrogenase n=1 Tax=Bacillus coahuilensis p1.1.43 TaxID=1150625 RepID=A0A147KBI2_9BACI|nr:SDR family oxidoreductase [Bacillus coahuilensis]KUP08503.1 hypothetical protein Q75_02455 [Bacillus coahuilensis p1.1.43]